MTEREAETDREIVTSHFIHGPRSLVFEAFTAHEHLARWWGPDGFTTTTRSFDFRPGGVWDFTMHGPDGTDYLNHVEWREIVPPERLVYGHGSGPGDPDTFVSTITLEEKGEGTTITLRSVFPTKAQRDRVVERYGALEGARQTLGRLENYIRHRSDR